MKAPSHDPLRPHVCFVALRAYNVLACGGAVRHVGGAEVQQALLAAGLVRRGYVVSFVVLDHGQPDGEELGGIRTFKAYRLDAGWPGLRFWHPRLTGLWGAMKRADADIYYQRGAEAETGLVARWCRAHGRQFVFGAAHDTNCDPALPGLPDRSERWLYRYGLRRAAAVITQTHTQQRLLRDGFGLPSTVIYNSCAAPADVSAASSDRLQVLWVGRLSPEKRPEWLVRLAADVPACRFLVVAHGNESSYYAREIAARLQSAPNVTWLGYVPPGEMSRCYAQASLLLSTSSVEGFPNVFLEAWAHARPVLASLDIDQLIQRHKLGWVCESYDALRACLAQLAAGSVDPAIGCAARTYVQQHHTVDGALDQLSAVLRKVARQPAQTPVADAAVSLGATDA